MKNDSIFEMWFHLIVPVATLYKRRIHQSQNKECWHPFYYSTFSSHFSQLQKFHVCLYWHWSRRYTVNYVVNLWQRREKKNYTLNGEKTNVHHFFLSLQCRFKCKNKDKNIVSRARKLLYVGTNFIHCWTKVFIFTRKMLFFQFFYFV